MANEVTSQATSKEVDFTDEQLAAALSMGANLQAQEVAEDGVKADYITLAKSGSKALDSTEKELYIEGLTLNDFYIQKDGVNLGKVIKVVPLSFMTVYNEKDKNGADAKFLGVWNKEQAQEFPLVDGSFYDRQLPNGHILTPSCWVLVEVIGHPEIENGIITYKSTGSRIFRQWKEDAKKRSGTSATLVYELSAMQVSNDRYKWNDIGFKCVGNLLEDDKAMAFKCVTKSNEIREAYQKHLFIADRAVATEKPQALKQAEAALIEDSTDDEELGF